MAEGLRLKLWGPNGESREFELNDRGEVIRALTDWANEIGCGPKLVVGEDHPREPTARSPVPLRLRVDTRR